MRIGSKKFKLLYIFTFITLFAIQLQCSPHIGYAAKTEPYKVKINNQTLEFMDLMVVDCDNGSDESGDGSQVTPFKSLQKAIDTIESTTTTSNCIILKGVDKTRVIELRGKSITIIGDYQAYHSTIQGAFRHINSEDNHKYGFASNLRFYGVKFDGVFTDTFSSTFNQFNKVELFNCILNEKTDYSNVNMGSTTFSNCFVEKMGFVHTITLKYINTVLPEQNISVDTNYNIVSDPELWKGKGTGLNPDGSTANLGVYGGPYAWKLNEHYFELNSKILQLIPDSSKIMLNENVKANLVIQNVKEIAAEDIRITYDNQKLKFTGYSQNEGILLVKNSEKNGELRIILASNGKNNVINDRKVLLGLNFTAIEKGDASIDVIKCRISDGINFEGDLNLSDCGNTIISIDGQLLDVNKNGSFTLLDLAIDARHLGESVESLPQYNTDIDINNAIDTNDLLKIAEYMLIDKNYNF